MENTPKKKCLRFIIIESIEEKAITKPSPFIIEKILASRITPKSVKKKTRNNTLLIGVERQHDAEILLRMTKFYGIRVKVYPHKLLNSSKGVVRSAELSLCTLEEIRNNNSIKKQNIIDIKRISIKKNDRIIDTNTYIMTFDAPEPPQEIKIGYTISKVETYIPNPLRCFNCQRYGHGKNQCTRKLVCGKCGENDPNHTELTCPNETNCSNCKQGL